MENNNMNEQQPNWQEALNEFSEQPEQQAQPQQFAQQAQSQQFAQQAQPQQYAQQAQPQQYAQQAQTQQYAQQAQPQQYAQQAQPQQYAQQAQTQYNQYAQQAQPQQFAQQAQPQYNQYAQDNQPQPGQYSQQAQFAQAQGQYTPQGMPAYDAGSFAVVPPQKKSKVLPIILIILAIAIVAGGVVFACLNLFKNNASGYEALERNYFASAEKKADELFNSAKNVKTGLEQTISINVSKDLIGSDVDIAPTVITAKSNVDSAAEKGSGSLTFSAGDNAYMNANFWLADGKVYYTVPELTDKYIVMDLNELSSSLKDISSGSSDFSGILTVSDVAEAPSASTNYEEILKNIDDETFDKIVDIITEAYFDNFTSVENKSDSFKMSDSTVDCTSYTIDFTVEKVIAFCTDVLDAVENESKIMDILSQLGIDNASFQYLKTLMTDSIKDATEEELSQVAASMIVYVKDNNIIGRKISIVDAIEAVLVTFSDKTQFEYSVNATITSSTNIYAGAKGTVNGNNYTGTASVTADGQTVITADFSFDATNGNGTYSFKVTTDDNETFEVKLNVAMDGNNGTFDIAVASNGTDMFTLKVDSKEVGYTEEALPEINSSNSVDISDSAALEAFSTEISANLPKLIDKMQSVANPDIVCYEFAQLISGSMVG